jgi:hypothetical protein
MGIVTSGGWLRRALRDQPAGLLPKREADFLLKKGPPVIIDSPQENHLPAITRQLDGQGSLNPAVSSQKRAIDSTLVESLSCIRARSRQDELPIS